MNRSLGLDIVRAIAIMLVLFQHSGMFYGIAFPGGVFGVELFFILSGLLIGQIFLKNHVEQINFKSTYYFWMRRWLRTLPLYYLVLIIRIFYVYPYLPSYKYFFFLQNFSEIDIDWFIIAWSLSIEEWFYLLLPILFLIAGRVTRISFTPRKINLFLVCIIGTVFFAKVYYILKFNPNFSFGIKKSIPFRMDALLIGVLLANIKLNYSHVYTFLSRRIILLFGVFFLLVVAGYFHWVSSSLNATNQYLEYSYFTRIFLLPIISFLFFIVIPSFDNSVFLKNIPHTHFISKLFYRISVYTYGLYLVHKDIFNILIKDTPLSFAWLIELLTSLGVTIAIVAILYRFFEKPIMNYRDKILPLSNLTNEKQKI